LSIFKSKKYRKCENTGHIAKKCHKKHSFQGEVEEQTFGLHGIQTVTKTGPSGYVVTMDVDVEGHKVAMLVAVVSIVPEQIYRKYLSHLPLRKAWDLRSYLGDKLNLLGVYGKQKCNLPLVIAEGNKPAFFRRNWLEKIKLGEIFLVDKSNPVGKLVKKYPKLFEEGYGKINNFKATVA